MSSISPKTTPWTERGVLSYAHQGGAREAPSSTMYALRRAVELGCDGLELDVHATADGHLVVCHDATVDRTTDGVGRIADLTLDQLRRLDNAHWWVPGEVVDHEAAPEAYVHRGRAPQERDFGVATLAEVLEAFPAVILNLDIKQTAPEVTPYEATLARVLADHGRSGDVLVASFDDRATAEFSRHAPGVPTSLGTAATAAFWQAVQVGSAPPPQPDSAVALQVPPDFQGITVVDERFVEAAHLAGLAVHVWTIDDAAEMDRLIDLGVDGVMTDRPGVLMDVLGQRGTRPRT